MLSVGSVTSDSSSVLHGRKDLTLSSNAAFTQSTTQKHVVRDATTRWSKKQAMKFYLSIFEMKFFHCHAY